MAEAMLEVLPNAAVHHIGMYRLKGTHLPVQYYNRLPTEPADIAFVLDPLIASGMYAKHTQHLHHTANCSFRLYYAFLLC
jgi:uracil phosphoribosyltransferase